MSTPTPVGDAFAVVSLDVLKTILYDWAFKAVYETLATPLTAWLVACDDYDTDTNFNPFAVLGSSAAEE